MRQSLKKNSLRKIGLNCATALLLTLASCGTDVPEAKNTFSRKPALPEMPHPDETVRGEDEPAVVTLKIGNTLRERPLGRVDDLPSDIVIPATNLQNVPVTSALEAVLAGTDVSLSYQGGDFDNRLVTLLNLNGPLPKVVQRICSAAKIFCAARDGNLELRDEESFIIELPPIERNPGAAGAAAGSAGATNTIADAIGELAGSKARVDDAGGNLIYTTSVEGQERVSKYLEQLRHGRPLVVLQMYIWEVSLDSRAAAGINWRNLRSGRIGGNLESATLASGSVFAPAAAAGASAFDGVTNGVSLGAVLSGKIGAEVIANFLSTQGAVQTLSNPQLTFVSGSNAEFRVGGTRSYISQVGQLTSNNVSGSSSAANGIGSNTVSTEKIETGLKINVNGSYESGVIFSTLNVSITDLVRIEQVNTGSTVLQLPETTDRNFSTVLRVRPGDNILLAGMTSTRDDLTRDRLNVPLLDKLPLNGADQSVNRELVVLLKPAVIFFADEKTIDDKTAKDQAAAALKKEAEAAARAAQAPPPEPAAAPAGMPQATAPIDKAWIQRGFAYALDELAAAPGRGLP